MEQRQDFIETQIDMISKILKKILEKLLKLKSSDISEEEMKNISDSEISENLERLTIEGLKKIEDSELIKILVGQFGYTNTSLRQLSDILFELSSKAEMTQFLKQKALIIYQYILLDKKKSVDFLILSRIKELETNLKDYEI